MNRSIIGIPIGDPSGIGPEIVVKAMNQEEIYKICKPVVIGDKNTILQAMKFCSIELAINTVEEPEDGKYSFGT
ncbi:MAG: 4-phospho-D-threonate 3-dehydrogenase, partial [Sedimentibacter sp.]